jgi:hypothetical protein
MLLCGLLRTAPTQPLEHKQQTFHHILVVAAILLKIESKTEGTQADIKLRTQVQTTYPKGYPASLTSDGLEFWLTGFLQPSCQLLPKPMLIGTQCNRFLKLSQVLDKHENRSKENPRNREPGCIYTIEY